MLHKKFHFKKFKIPATKLFLAALVGIFFILLFYLYIAFLIPIPSSLLLEQKNNFSTKIYDRHGQLLYEVLNPEQGRKTYLKLEQMPKAFVQAVIASEDSDYYNHVGVDLPAIFRAFIYNSLEQKITSGASTITQQLVRNLMGTNRPRNLSEKLLESIYAVRLSHLYSKEEVLEHYLNTVYFGNQSYGAPAAALNYFNKNLYDLDLAELAMLAGLPQSPSNFNPLINPDLSKKRQQYVLDRMLALGQITKEQAEEALSRPFKFRRNKVIMKAPHFVQHIIAELEQKYGEDLVNRGGLSITTTLDYSLQQKAEQIIDNQLEKLQQKHVTNAALLSTDLKTGQILVWVGSRNFFDESIDGQVDLITSLRQPGSALKPFLYLLALEKGSTLATVIADLPFKIQTPNGNYSPLNYDLDFHGPVRIREALANSFNIPAVKMLDQLKVENFLSFLRNLGLKSLNQSPEYYGLALTLGGGEVRLYDLLGAYSVLANYGRQSQFSDLLEVTDSSGQILEKWRQPGQIQKLGPKGAQNSFLITDTLSDPNARLKSFGEGNVLELGFPAAVKTGTTRNFKDNWTFGYSTNILTGVWVGNSDASSMENISGIDGAGPIWHDFMAYYHQFAAASSFPVPSGLKQLEICAVSGLLPGENCQEKIQEWFTVGTEPRQLDSYYQKYYCANSHPAEKILLQYPQEYQKWAEERGFLATNDCRSLAPSDQSSSGSANQAVSSPSKLDLPPVQITSPLSKDAFQIDQNLPLTSQKIPLRYLLNQSATQINLLLDDKVLADCSLQSQNAIEPLIGAQSCYWLPAPGPHSLKIEIFSKGKEKASSEKIDFFVN